MRKWLPGLALLSVVSLFLGTYVGSVSLSPSDVTAGIAYGIKSTLSAFFPGISPGEKPRYFVIIWELRLPRVLLAYLVGTALASAGVASQALFRNPLADPYIIGVSAGAGIGAALGAIYAPQHMGGLALASALLSVFIVYTVSKVDGRVPVDTLLLAGIAYGFLAGAVTWYLIISQGERAHVTWMWLMGTFNGSSWRDVGEMFIVALLGVGFLVWKWRELNLILLGEESIALGLDLHLYRKLFIVAIALLTAFAVSTAGIIGFIGLVSPHIMRLLLGPNHRELTPASALFGGTLLVVADLLARILARPAELPVGIITALMGAPFFLYLLMKHKRGELYS
ncbi:iron(III)-siderophore ABC transporter permease 2 [Thermococcus cleftensis]|uniref:Iron(III)-siderophore ABC transporter permease 2 n=1 Tax=Thermococcus cleftensis (strain DSM 27260 / KACC 17922 / CL1) TaxID=163003 RepID=I3ZUX1_THECF|nr:MULTISPECIES: iron chelate uptake ABC transporter family permease subunit [Thermococcus]AFL95505.1 iron(III)-siderophore ABC transporter permease 2 [Thermococcus cleftensis]NJE03975.1 iron ABC transporter permease [Thermococcus sp. MV11]